MSLSDSFYLKLKPAITKYCETHKKASFNEYASVFLFYLFP
jgi:hypothetical protein